jgi:hypothetical protein
MKTRRQPIATTILCPTTGLATALCAALVLLPAAGAHADVGSRQSAEVRFGEQQPGSASGLSVSFDYVNPDDPAGKPPAVRDVVEELPPGAHIDTGVPALCPASEAELILLGAGACPDASRVGAGKVTIDTGLPEPLRFLHEDVTFFNADRQLIFLFEDSASGARVPVRSQVEDGRRIVTKGFPLPGTPPDGGAIDTVEIQLDQISGGGHAYITTPPTCSGSWESSVAFTYADSVTQTVRSQSPCTPAGGAPAPGAAPVAAIAAPAAVRKRCKGKRRPKAGKRKRCRKR